MKHLILVAALSLIAGISRAEPVELSAIECYGIDVSSSPLAGDVTALFTTTVTRRNDGRWIRKAVTGWQYFDVQNSTNIANVYIRFDTPIAYMTQASATINGIPAISSSPIAGVTTRGWKIAAGGDKSFYVPPGRIPYARNDGEAGTSGVTVCPRR